MKKLSGSWTVDYELAKVSGESLAGFACGEVAAGLLAPMLEELDFEPREIRFTVELVK